MKQDEKYTRHYFKRFFFEIGNRFDGYEVFEIKNEENCFEIEYNHKKSSVENIKSIKSKEYETILDKIKIINIEKWDKEYSDKLFTGNEWKLKMYFKPSIVIEKEGGNNFPENINEVISLIRTYFPDFISDTNKKTTLNEKELFKLYCSNCQGTSFSEVSIGKRNLSENSNDRKMDIVRIENDHYKWVRKYANSKEQFHEIVGKYKVELVEIKTKLNRGVIGQIIVGEYLFSRSLRITINRQTGIKNMKKSTW